MRFIVLLLALQTTVFARNIPVSDASTLAAAVKSARPGDHLILGDGEYRDLEIVFIGKGTESAPITLRAENPGKAVLRGRSSLKIGGEYLQVEGLRFLNPDSTMSDLIEFRRDSKTLASHCRLTNCQVVHDGDETHELASESRWVGLCGSNHRVDQCSFEGKRGKGTTFVVWLDESKPSGGHQIDHNYFGPREKLGSNGGETIRIGDSKTSMLPGRCLVDHNLFEKCNGEAECISNKSCQNVYRENTFFEVSGTLTLRHGNECRVERNVFLGNGANGTGGIRVIGDDHVVEGNYFCRLTGDDARSAICLMMGIPNSPVNRYFQVQRATIANNTIDDCKHSILIGLSDDKNASLAPVETVFRGNQISSPKGPVIEARCDLGGIVWIENRMVGKSLGIPATSGIEITAPKIIPLDPISRSSVGTNW